MIEFCEPPVNKLEDLLLRVDDDVLGFDIPVDDASRVAVIECLKKFIEIKSDILVAHGGDERAEIYVLEIVENDADSPGGGIPDHILELDDAGVAVQGLEDLYFPLHLALLDGLEHLDDHVLVGGDIDACVHLRVFALPYFVDDLVVVDVPALVPNHTRTRSRRLRSYSTLRPSAC